METDIDMGSIIFHVLSEDQIEKITQTAFNILKNTGCKISHKGAIKLCEDAGAIIEGERVRVTQKIIDFALNYVPKGFSIYNRNGKKAMDVRGRNVYYGTSTASPNTKDPFTGEIRSTQIADIATAAKLTDALSNIDYAMPMGSAQDVPAIAADLHEFFAVVTNSIKPVIFNSYSPRGTQLIYKMAEQIAGGIDNLQEHPFLLAYPEPVSPLLFPYESVEKMFISVDLNLPFITASTVQPGATAPMTMAGAVAQLVAEGLMSIILAQLRNLGAPCILGGNYNIFDMKTALLSIAAPENSLGIIAQAEIAQSLGLPSWGLAGATDSKLIDSQAGLESAFSILLQSLGGLNLIHDVGYMDMAMVCSMEMLVLGDEIIGMVKHFLRGVEVNQDTLAEDLVAKVGPGGHFLEEKHTLRHFRKELWMPSLLTRNHYTKWVREGSKDLTSQILEKIKYFLDSHKVPLLLSNVIEALEIIKTKGEIELLAQK